MTAEKHALEELVKVYNENNKEGARMEAMAAQTAADMYGWAATVVYGVIRNVWEEYRDYTLDVATDTCPFGNYKYAKMEVL